MNTIINSINIFRKEHKFLFFATCISIILSMIEYIIGDILLEFRLNLILFFSLIIFPFVFSILINLLSLLVYKKHKTCSKIFSAIFHTFNIVIIQLGILIIYMFLLSILSPLIPYTSPDEYITAKNSVYIQERVAHFPTEIPNNAKNIKFYKISNHFGDDLIWLKFDTSPNFIQKEINKYKFKKIKNINDYYIFFKEITNKENTNIDNYMLYIIDDEIISNGEISRPLYFYGLGCNKTKTEIIYFYNFAEPD